MVSVTVRSEKPFRLRRVTYDHFATQADVDECLRYPRVNARLFREAVVEGPQSFAFNVPTSEHVSPFGIARNKFSWRRFAVFRLESDKGRVLFVGVEVPDVRTMRAIAIDVP